MESTGAFRSVRVSRNAAKQPAPVRSPPAPVKPQQPSGKRPVLRWIIALTGASVTAWYLAPTVATLPVWEKVLPLVQDLYSPQVQHHQIYAPPPVPGPTAADVKAEIASSVQAARREFDEEIRKIKAERAALARKESELYQNLQSANEEIRTLKQGKEDIFNAQNEVRLLQQQLTQIRAEAIAKGHTLEELQIRVAKVQQQQPPEAPPQIIQAPPEVPPPKKETLDDYVNALDPDLGASIIESETTSSRNTSPLGLKFAQAVVSFVDKGRYNTVARQTRPSSVVLSEKRAKPGDGYVVAGTQMTLSVRMAFAVKARYIQIEHIRPQSDPHPECAPIAVKATGLQNGWAAHAKRGANFRPDDIQIFEHSQDLDLRSQHSQTIELNVMEDSTIDKIRFEFRSAGEFVCVYRVRLYGVFNS